MNVEILRPFPSVAAKSIKINYFASPLLFFSAVAFVRNDLMPGWFAEAIALLSLDVGSRMCHESGAGGSDLVHLDEQCCQRVFSSLFYINKEGSHFELFIRLIDYTTLMYCLQTLKKVMDMRR